MRQPKRRTLPIIVSAFVALGPVMMAIPARAEAAPLLGSPRGVIERASVSSNEGQGNGSSASFGPSISADGRLLAFASKASNLVPRDTNGVGDAFLRNESGATFRASVSSSGVQGNGKSFDPALSAGGRYVVFLSDATNLVPHDTNDVTDVFVKDRRTGQTERVSLGRGGVQGNAAASYRAAITADGRYVVFRSAATNLVRNDTNGKLDLFIRDRVENTTRRVSVATDGSQANGSAGEPALSPDGRFLVFQSGASNLVPDDANGVYDVFIRDLRTGVVDRISDNAEGGSGNAPSLNPAVSRLARVVAFGSQANDLVAGDTNGVEDAFVWTRATGVIERVSISSGSTQGNGASGEVAISGDGRFVAFGSRATNLAPTDDDRREAILLRDRALGNTRLISFARGGDAPNGASYRPAMAVTRLVVAFTSGASNLVPADSNGVDDAFTWQPGTARQRVDAAATGARRVSVSSTERQANGPNKQSAISASGRFVVYASDAANLVGGDSNDATDVFRRDLRTGTTKRISVSTSGRQANADSTQPVVSRDGSVVAYVSKATNLVRGDTNRSIDVFVWQSGKTRRLSVGVGGRQANADNFQPAISADGTAVAFESAATNLISGDSNHRMDVYRRLTAGASGGIERASVGAGGQQGNGPSFGPSLSASGDVIAFMSSASNLVPGDDNQTRDVFVRSDDETELVSVATAGQQGDGDSVDPSISAAGTVVAFASDATNLVAADDNGDADVFVRDLSSDETSAVSVRGAGNFVNGTSDDPAISGDAGSIAFTSTARLVPADTRSTADIFVRNLATDHTRRASVPRSGQANRASDEPTLSFDGMTTCFSSDATNLVARDTNDVADIFVHS